MTQYMAAPSVDGTQSSIPRRVGTRSMLPSTWINREVHGREDRDPGPQRAGGRAFPHDAEEGVRRG